jgi:hypothetical protein
MSLATPAASVFAIATMAAITRCAPIQSQPKQVPADRTVAVGAPVIDSARPDSVIMPYGAVVEVTLSGAGFVPGKPGQNTVHFNGTSLRLVPASSDGRQIVFAIPDRISHGGEAPPSALRSGSYSVSVETTSGTSNAVTVRVYR